MLVCPEFFGCACPCCIMYSIAEVFGGAEFLKMTIYLVNADFVPAKATMLFQCLPAHVRRLTGSFLFVLGIPISQFRMYVCMRTAIVRHQPLSHLALDAARLARAVWAHARCMKAAMQPDSLR